MKGANLNWNVIFNRSDIPAESKGEVGVSPAKSRGDCSRELFYFTLPSSMELQYFRELEKIGNCISKVKTPCDCNRGSRCELRLEM